MGSFSIIFMLFFIYLFWYFVAHARKTCNPRALLPRDRQRSFPLGSRSWPKHSLGRLSCSARLGERWPPSLSSEVSIAFEAVSTISGIKGSWRSISLLHLSLLIISVILRRPRFKHANVCTISISDIDFQTFIRQGDNYLWDWSFYHVEGHLPSKFRIIFVKKLTCPTITRDKGKDSPAFGCKMLFSFKIWILS